MEKALEDMPQMKTDISEMRVKLDVLWRIHLSKSTSLINLNDNELKVLRKSGIDSFVNDHYAEILSTVKDMRPYNTNEVQTLPISVVNRYKKDSNYRSTSRGKSFEWLRCRFATIDCRGLYKGQDGFRPGA